MLSASLNNFKKFSFHVFEDTGPRYEAGCSRQKDDGLHL